MDARGLGPAVRLGEGATHDPLARAAPRHFFSRRRRHTMYIGDWSSDVCSSDLGRSSAVFPGTTPPQRFTVIQHLPTAALRFASNASIVVVAGMLFNGMSTMVVTPPVAAACVARSEERRVGKEGRREWGARGLEV